MNTVINYTTKETAKLIKQELNGLYPHIKFSVTTPPRRSVLSAPRIDVRFTATTNNEVTEIEKLVQKYEAGKQIVGDVEVNYDVTYLFTWGYTAKAGA